MSAEVESMAYAGQVPWHGLGVKVPETLTPDEMLVAAGLDWNVNKRPLVVQGTDIVVPDMHALQRDSDNRVLGICGPQYEPFGNSQVFSFFDKFCKGGSLAMETAGSLRDGKHVWALARMKQSFTLAGDDVTRGYILLSHPHVWGKSLRIMFTPTRVVCMNTLTYALQNAENAFRLPHIYTFDEQVMELAADAIGLAAEEFVLLDQKAELLAGKEFTEDTLNKFVADLMQPELIIERGPKDDTVVNLNEFKRNAFIVRNAVDTQPGKDLPTKNTWWAAANAVTYAVDHVFGQDRNAALENAWFGARAKLKREAIDLAVEYAKAA